MPSPSTSCKTWSIHRTPVIYDGNEKIFILVRIKNKDTLFTVKVYRAFHGHNEFWGMKTDRAQITTSCWPNAKIFKSLDQQEVVAWLDYP